LQLLTEIVAIYIFTPKTKVNSGDSFGQNNKQHRETANDAPVGKSVVKSLKLIKEIATALSSCLLSLSQTFWPVKCKLPFPTM